MKPKPPGIDPKTPPIPGGNGSAIPKKTTTNPAPEKRTETLRQCANWSGLLVTLPAGVFSFASGIYSFLGANTSIGESDSMDHVANISSRLAYFSYGLGGTLTNVENKNLFGSVGYAFNLFIAPFAPQDLIYPLTGLTSALDTIPLTAETISESKTLSHLGDALHKKYNPEEEAKFKFTNFESWGQGIDRINDSIKISIKDLIKNFDSKTPIKSIGEMFKRADFNLLSSSVGLFISFCTLCLTPFKTLSKGIRDLFGLQADVGILQGGLNGTIKDPEAGQKFTTTGKWRKWGDKLYAWTGPPQILATFLDFIYRVSPIENLHLAALGVDRLGAASMAVGNICHDASKKEGAEYYMAA